jgi:hypothetical protein
MAALFGLLLGVKAGDEAILTIINLLKQLLVI